MWCDPWMLDEGEHIEFYRTGARRSGGYRYKGEPYYHYGNIVVVGPEGCRRTLARDVYEGFFEQYFQGALSSVK